VFVDEPSGSKPRSVIVPCDPLPAVDVTVASQMPLLVLAVALQALTRADAGVPGPNPRQHGPSSEAGR
jgi:hypothetical protein